MYILFDLEATCEEDKKLQKQKGQEIIEIGFILLDNNLVEVLTCQSFVKPCINPILSDYCKSLTNIKQEDVDNAKPFHIVYYRILEVLKEVINDPKDFIYMAWGHWDREMFDSDCNLHGLDNFMVKYVSLKDRYKTIKGLEKNPSQKDALIDFGVVEVGKAHRALTDAQNLANLFKKDFSFWKMDGLFNEFRTLNFY